MKFMSPIKPQIMFVAIALLIGLLVCARLEPAFTEGIIGCVTGLTGIAGSLIEAELKKSER